MRRRYDLIDMVMAIGFCATIVAANGMITIALAENLSDEGQQVMMVLGDTRWLQPVLDQAIVDQDLLDRRHAIALLKRLM